MPNATHILQLPMGQQEEKEENGEKESWEQLAKATATLAPTANLVLKKTLSVRFILFPLGIYLACLDKSFHFSSGSHQLLCQFPLISAASSPPP